MNLAMNTAVYGLGNMGYLIAQRIATRLPTLVADLNIEAVERAEKEFGAKAVTESALGSCKAVVLCLPSPAASFAVLQKIGALLPKDCVVIETSTVNPQDVLRAQSLLQPYGIRVVDASILAGVSQMAAGTATLLVGGDAATLAQVAPVLDAIAEKQTVFGGLGAGAAAKVINNAVAHAVMVVVAEAGSMATATGISTDKLVALLADPEMGLHRPLTFRFAQRVRRGDYDGGMPTDAARKDSTLALELAHSAGVPLFAIQAAHSVYEMAVRSGYGREDYAAVARLWSDWGCPAVPND